MKDLRLQETATLFYRILLAYLFYQAARLLFYLFNRNLIKIDGVQDYLVLAYHGTAFDTTAILYVNSLFILLSLVPFTVNTKPYYQRFLFWLYFITNGIAFAMNFGDFIYYKFSQARLTMAAMSVAQHEDNLAKVFFVSILEHPFVILSYIVLMTLWVFLYKKVKIQPRNILVKWKYFVSSVVTLCLVATLVVGGIRGDFRHSTRPINMVDANRHVKNPLQANVVLNSVFSFFRTLGSNNFKEVKFVDDDFIQQNIKPYKTYIRKVEEPKPNVVIFILESFGKEYIGAFNRDTKIDGFVSYTPFIDSLAAHSLIAENAYANGRQSIHGMSSILAGIPALKDAFTGSPYSNQMIQSIVSVSNEMGYDTSFFHGAPNGSMGFQGFGNILGFKHYYGKTEYNNDADFDGMWGIWDEPFFQHFANTLAVKKTPFMATLFSVSSHHPFKVPQKYEGKFPKGTLDIHAPIGYTDYALKKFFETAKKMPWFQNTIFVLVADHTNQVGYPEYEKAMNRFAIPILFYSPNERYGLQGVVTQPAQQMDIYPTLADLMGYNKKIRSWGRSLVTPTPEDYLIVNSSGVEQFIIGDYIHLFDGKSFTGLYDKQDLGFEDNLIGKINNAEVKQGQMKAKAWYQDYMDRVINRKLN